MSSIRFRNDKRLRDKLFSPESYSHPAKGHLGMWAEIIQRYTREGDTILDPMAGVGATLTAALMGRHVVCVELEPHFIVPMKASWEKMRQHPMLGHTLGEVLILRGDARCLSLGSADHIVTSPPYEGSVHDNQEGPLQHSFPGGWKAGTVDKHGGYTRPSAIITSPPFQDQEPAQDKAWLAAHAHEITSGGKAGVQFGPAMAHGYTRPVDAVVSSPPYEGQMTDPHDRKRSIDEEKWGDGRALAPPHS